MTRTLHFERDVDKSGVSGPGQVALAVEWPDGSYHVWWHPDQDCDENGRYDKLGTHGWMPDTAELLRVHGHQGATRFVYDDTGEELTRAQAKPWPDLPWGDPLRPHPFDAAEETKRVVIEGQGPVPTIEEYEQEQLVSDGYIGPLTDEQRARIEALRAAREVLVAKAATGFASSGAVAPASSVDLVSVANWIINGDSSWAESQRAPF